MTALIKNKSHAANWHSTSLAEVCSKITDGVHNTPKYQDKGVPFISVKDIYNGKVNFGKCKFISAEEHHLLTMRCNPEPGDLLLTKSGTIGRLAIVPESPEFSLFVSVALLKNYKKVIDSKFLLFLLENYINSINIGQEIKGGVIKNFHLEDIRKAQIEIAPLPEQRMIVDKIESLFSELDNAVDNIKTAMRKLKVYRQAVLQQAFTGELTKKWREEHPDLPTAGELLEKIKSEREEHYQNQLRDWKQAVKDWEEAGKKGKKPSRPKKPAEVEPLSEEELKPLPELPSGWSWIKLNDISDNVEYGTSSKSQKSGKVPVIRMGNIQNSKIDWSDLVYSSDENEINKYILNDGDVLFNRTNSPELVGKSAIFKGDRKAIFAGYLIRIVYKKKFSTGDFINYFLNSHQAKVHGNFVKTDGVNQSNINGEKLRKYPFPICSLEEQRQIVVEVERRLSVCEKVEGELEAALKRSGALRRSILKRAFEGRLLNERELEEARRAPDWEPADKLLRRLAAERK